MNWTDKELNIIEAYSKKVPRDSLLNCLVPLFPNRVRRNIRRKIRELYGRTLPIWTDKDKEDLKEIYRTSQIKNIKEKLEKRFPDKRIDTIYNKAYTLGFSNNNWSTEEVNIVESMAGRYTPKTICSVLKKKGFKRTVNAIDGLFDRMKWSRKIDEYSCREISIGFGCPWSKVVEWIITGHLKGEQNGKNKFYKIKPKDIANFIRKYPFEINYYKPDIPWVIALLDEFRKEKNNGTE